MSAVVCVLFLFTKVGLGDSYNIDLAVEYFSNRQVNSVCLISCGEVKELKDFAEKAAPKLISIRATKANNMGDILSCIEQTKRAAGVLIDINCKNAIEVLEFASQEKLFNDMHKWLIMEKEIRNISSLDVEDDLNITIKSLRTHYGDVLFDANKIKTSSLTVQILISLNLSIDADVTVAVQKEASYYEFYEVYNFGKIQGGSTKIILGGSWSPTEGLYLRNSGYKYYSRWNFEKLNLKIICVMLQRPKIFHPELLTGREFTSGVAAITKTSTMVLEVFREVHNISFSYTITDRWIGLTKKNSTRVVSNSLLFREQDITPCIRLATSLIAQLDPILPSTSAIETKFFYRIPTKGIGKIQNEFGRPYSTGSWLCAISAMIVCGFLLLVTARMGHHSSPSQYAVFTVIAAVCQQCYDDNIATTGYGSAARQLISLVTGTCCLLLYNYYTSSVVSWLLNGPAPSIHSLKELMDSPLNLIFEDVGYTRTWLQTSGYYFNPRNAYHEDLLRQTKTYKWTKNPPLKGLEEGIELVRSGGYAYHTEPYNANLRISRTFTPTDLCQLGTLQMMEKTPLYAAVQHKSPYKEFFTWSTMRAYERGHVKCIQRRVAMHILGCEGSTPTALSLGGAAPAFSILLFGFFLSALIVFLERFRHRLLAKINLTCLNGPYAS